VLSAPLIPPPSNDKRLIGNVLLSLEDDVNRLLSLEKRHVFVGAVRAMKRLGLTVMNATPALLQRRGDTMMILIRPIFILQTLITWWRVQEVQLGLNVKGVQNGQVARFASCFLRHNLEKSERERSDQLSKYGFFHRFATYRWDT
jgi:hypothetical protein